VDTSETIPVFDGHNDTLLHLAIEEPGTERSFFEGRERGHLDFPRARKGGFAGGFFAMFVPSREWEKKLLWRSEGPNGPDRTAGWDVPLAGPAHQQRAMNSVMKMMAALLRMERLGEGKLTVVRTHEELTGAMEEGTMAAVMHVEGAEAFTKDLAALPVLYEAGLRSLGPVWSRPNVFAHGVPFNFPDSPDIGEGLTPAGRDLVRLCNELGVMLDLSHMNERGFWDVASLSRAPLVASHSGVHRLCPSPRNLTDDQLEAVGESGGIVGVNFARAFVRADGLFDEVTSLTEIGNHVEYVAEKIGADHVGLGSDFDGTQLPQDMRDVTGLPLLLEDLERRGIRGETLRKIAHGNWLRVLQRTWKD
jgi:membrane dipeptidase